MEISDKMYNVLGLVLLVVGIAVQVWAIVLQTAQDIDVTWASLSIIILAPGSVLLTAINIKQLYSLHKQVHYIIALLGFVCIVMLVIFREYLTNLLLPRTIIVPLLIVDSLWIFLLGLLTNRFKSVKIAATSLT